MHRSLPEASTCAVDSGADLATRYYSEERGDVILNPLDSRCVAWSPLAEIRNLADCMAIARSICPTGEGAVHSSLRRAQLVCHGSVADRHAA